MNKLSTTAKNLDTFFKIFGILLTIAAVACLVGLGVVAVSYIFQLAPEQIGTGYEILDVGFLELQVAEGFVPDFNGILLQVAVTLLLAFGCVLIGKCCVKCIREILQPMTQGKPFHSTVSSNLKKLAVFSLILGIAANCIEQLGNFMLVHEFGLVDLLLSEKISHVSVNYTFDLSFLVITAVLLLLSYIFRYGEELQQLSDETL